MNKKQEKLTENELFMYRLDAKVSMLLEILCHRRGVITKEESKTIQLAGYDSELMESVE